MKNQELQVYQNINGTRTQEYLPRVFAYTIVPLISDATDNDDDDNNNNEKTSVSPDAFKKGMVKEVPKKLTRPVVSSHQLTDNDRRIMEKEKELNFIQSSIERLTQRQSRNEISPDRAANKQKKLLDKFK